MHTIVIGLNHKTAEVFIREKCNFAFDELPQALQQLKEESSVEGAVILSTCNRVEIYASVKDIERGSEDVTNFMASYHNIPIEELKPFLYIKNCEQAVMHLFKVTSGIDSMVVGEYQIQGQIRDAYQVACSLNMTDSFLNKLFQLAVSTGKRVRTETEIGRGRLSVAHLAVELIKRIFPERRNLEILLVGAGKIAKLTAENLNKHVTNRIYVSNRSEDNSKILAEQFNAEVIPYIDRCLAVEDKDVIITSTSADNYTIVKSEITKLSVKDKNKKKLFIDLSIPRNIDPSINDLENCSVYSIDDINKMIHVNVNKRTKEVEKAEIILEEVSEDFHIWYHKQIIMPTMASFKGKLENLKTQILGAHKTELKEMSKDHQDVVKQILSSYSDKLIKTIMKNLSAAVSKDDMHKIIDSLKKLSK